MKKTKQNNIFSEHLSQDADMFPTFVMPKNVVGKKFPAEYLPKPKVTKANDTNSLTKTIVTYLQLNQIQCSRINTQGQFQMHGKTFVQGKEFIYGMWAKSGSTKGVADLICAINGHFVAIEIKVGTDKQSAEQTEWQKNHEKNGGIYYIAKDFDSFKIFIDKLLASAKQ